MLLANHFLRNCATGLSQGEVYLSPETERIFNRYPWRGNIRELENVIKRAVVLVGTGPILSEHLPDHLIEQNQQTVQAANGLENQLKQLIQGYLKQNQESYDGYIYDNLIKSVEKQLFKVLLDKYYGNQVSVAKVLGINRNTLKRKIEVLKIDIKKYKKNKCL